MLACDGIWYASAFPFYVVDCKIFVCDETPWHVRLAKSPISDCKGLMNLHHLLLGGIEMSIEFL